MTDQQPQYVVLERAPTSGLAVASMVLGIVGLLVGLCSFGVLSFVAVGAGHLALVQDVKRLGKSGKGMAVAGLVLGYIVVVPVVLWIGLASAGGLIELLKSWM